MADNDIQYGIIAIVLGVIFLVSSMDLLETAIFSREFSSLAAFVLVGIGAYLLGKNNK